LRILAFVVAAAALVLGLPAAALADAGNPNYRSVVKQVTPAGNGLTLSVLNYDDRLLLQNSGHKNVTVLDYQNKPYIHAEPDGTIAVNTNSEAYYLNVSRTGDAPVPPNLPSTPKWKVVARNGRYDWHDHRIHWMGTQNPPDLKNTSQRTLINTWKVPIEVGGTKGDISGTLTWVGKGKDSLPIGAIFAFIALLVVLSAGVLVIRRRRDAAYAGAPGTGAASGRGSDDDAAAPSDAPKPPKQQEEAW
jgi:hypothetical protein